MDDREIEQQLQRALRSRRLTDDERNRLRNQLISRAVKEQDSMSTRGAIELTLLVAVLVAMIAFTVWQADLFGSSDESSPIAGEQATSDQTAGVASPSSATVASAGSPGGRGTCAATAPDPNPPVRLQTLAPAVAHAWFGNEDETLWAAPVVSYGPWMSARDTERLWFAGARQPVLWSVPDEVKVSGRRLDGEGVIEAVEQSEFGPPSNPTRSTILSIPSPGCWEIAARAGDDTLKIVANVRPFEERPDVAALIAEHERILEQFPVPSTCEVTPWEGPLDQGDYTIATFVMRGEHFSATNQYGIVAAEAEHPLLWTSELGADTPIVEVQAQLIDQPSVRFTSTGGAEGDGSLISPRFPQSGCWRVRVISATASEDFTLFVHPPEFEPGL